MTGDPQGQAVNNIQATLLCHNVPAGNSYYKGIIGWDFKSCKTYYHWRKVIGAKW